MTFQIKNSTKLQKKKILIKFYSNFNKSALYIAVEKGNINMVKTLLSNKNIEVNLLIRISNFLF